MNNQEKFAEEVINSTAGMQRATAPADLYERVMERMQTGRKTVPLLPKVAIWQAAAAILLLAALNVYICLQVMQPTATTANNSYIEQEYFSHTESI
jgi:hypothetical protein